MVLAIGSGVLAAAAIGKVPPVLELLRQEYSLSLVYAGWIVSIFSALGLITGASFGTLADRLGSRRVLLAGLWALVVAGLMGVLASTSLALLLTRLVEGAGFLAVAVGAPGVIVSASAPQDRPWSLGLWSVYVPAGISLAMVTATLTLDRLGWRGLWIFFAVLAGALALLGQRLLPRDIPLPSHKPLGGNLTAVLSRPGPWLLATSFTAYTLMWIPVMTWLPTYLIDQRGMPVEIASLLTATVVAANIPGNLLGTWLLRWRWLGGTISTLAGLIMGLSAWVVFDRHFSDSVRYACCLIFSCAGGMLPAAVLGTSRVHAPDPQRIGTVNGIIIQGSHLGQFSGPPMVAALVTMQGNWESIQGYMIGCALVAMALSWMLRRIEHRSLS